MTQQLYFWAFIPEEWEDVHIQTGTRMFITALLTWPKPRKHPAVLQAVAISTRQNSQQSKEMNYSASTSAESPGNRTESKMRVLKGHVLHGSTYIMLL